MTNAMSAENRDNVEQKFRASGFDNFADVQRKEDLNRSEMRSLFFNPANRKMNKTWGGRGGRGGRRGGDAGRDNGERIMQIERLSEHDVGLTFQGFFDPSLKD